MDRKLILTSTLLVGVALLLAACSVAVAPTPVPTQASTSAPTQSQGTSTARPKSSEAFETKSNEGGGVTVEVTPSVLEVGKPIAFDIAMNTHSVDLSDDMTKIVILRDDAGKEYPPTAWEGPGGGGHHRSGTLKFAPLTSKPKFVELVVKGLAKVPERVFRWDSP